MKPFSYISYLKSILVSWHSTALSLGSSGSLIILPIRSPREQQLLHIFALPVSYLHLQCALPIFSYLARSPGLLPSPTLLNSFCTEDSALISCRASFGKWIGYWRRGSSIFTFQAGRGWLAGGLGKLLFGVLVSSGRNILAGVIKLKSSTKSASNNFSVYFRRFRGSQGVFIRNIIYLGLYLDALEDTIGRISPLCDAVPRGDDHQPLRMGCWRECICGGSDQHNEIWCERKKLW